MGKIDISDIPQLDAEVHFDTEEAHSNNVIHPIFIPVLIATVMIA